MENLVQCIRIPKNFKSCWVQGEPLSENPIFKGFAYLFFFISLEEKETEEKEFIFLDNRHQQDQSKKLVPDQLIDFSTSKKLYLYQFL